MRRPEEFAGLLAHDPAAAGEFAQHQDNIDQVSEELAEATLHAIAVIGACRHDRTRFVMSLFFTARLIAHAANVALCVGAFGEPEFIETARDVFRGFAERFRTITGRPEQPPPTTPPSRNMN